MPGFTEGAHGADGDEPEFLGPEWVERLDARTRATAALVDAAEVTVVVEQRVSTDHGEVAYHLVLGPGPARVFAGRASAPDLTMVTTEAAARRVHAGLANAQTCLADGTLRLRGNPDVLTRHAPAIARVGAGSPARR